jgi:hypothetical protein
MELWSEGPTRDEVRCIKAGVEGAIVDMVVAVVAGDGLEDWGLVGVGKEFGSEPAASEAERPAGSGTEVSMLWSLAMAMALVQEPSSGQLKSIPSVLLERIPE